MLSAPLPIERERDGRAKLSKTTFALMLGAKMPELPTGKRWYGDSDLVDGKWRYVPGLLEVYDSRSGIEPHTDDSYEIVGFFVAVGASGKRGAPRLSGPLDIALIEMDARYADACKRARAAWEMFAAFCADHNVMLPEPRMYLVQTDVA